MPHHKFMDRLFVLMMQVLKFVQGRKSLDIQPVGQDQIRLSAEQFLRFNAGDLADGGEDRATHVPRRVRSQTADRYSHAPPARRG